MDKDNKRILKNTVFLYVRMVFLIAINLLTSRFVLQLLGVKDFGVYQVVGGIVLIFSVINGALSSGSSRFITIALGKGDNDYLKKIFNVSFECHLILSVLILVIAEIVGLWYLNTYLEVPEGRIAAANWIYQFSVISCLLSITQVPYSADIIAHERMDIYAYVGIAEGLFKMILVGALFLCKNVDLLILYGAMVCIWSILLQVYYRWFCYHKYNESHLVLIKDKILFKEMLSFSFWDVVGAFTVNGNYQGINLLINKFFGVVYNASYGITRQINGILDQFVGNFMTAVNPQITKDFANGEIDKMKRLVYMSSKLGFILYCFIGIPFFVEADYILNIWLEHVPDKTSLFLRLTVVICLIRAFSRPVITAVHASGNIKQLNVFSGGQSVALIIPLTYIFYKTGMPVESSFFVLILCSLIGNFMELFCLHREIPLYGIWEYTLKVYFPCVLVCIVAFLIDYLFVSVCISNFYRLVATVMVNAITVSLLSLLLLMNAQQRKLVLRNINDKLFSHIEIIKRKASNKWFI